MSCSKMPVTLASMFVVLLFMYFRIGKVTVNVKSDMNEITSGIRLTSKHCGSFLPRCPTTTKYTPETEARGFDMNGVLFCCEPRP